MPSVFSPIRRLAGTKRLLATRAGRRRGLHYRDRQRQSGADRGAGAQLAGSDADAQQAALDSALRFQQYPMIPA
jgi:hypothetical protein